MNVISVTICLEDVFRFGIVLLHVSIQSQPSFLLICMSLLSKCNQRLIISSAGVSVGNVITPVQTEVFRTEGDNITLSCNYSSAISLQWSRQYPNSAPEYLLVILHGTGQVSQKSKLVDQDPRFNGKLNEKKTLRLLW